MTVLVETFYRSEILYFALSEVTQGSIGVRRRAHRSTAFQRAHPHTNLSKG